MDDFWTHKENMPAEKSGYGQFTLKHFFLLAVSVFLIASFVILYQRSDEAKKILLLRSVAFTLIFIDIIKMILIHRSDVKLSDYLPLEICSFAAYFIVLDSVFTGNTIFPDMLLTLFLPAAIMAILFPTTSTLPMCNFYTIHQFLYHALIIAYIMARFLSREIPLTYPGVWTSILQILLLAGIIYLIDTRYDKNFMFLRDPYGNPLLGLIWKYTKGGFRYTLGLVAFCILMIHVFFVFFKLIAFLFLH